MRARIPHDKPPAAALRNRMTHTSLRLGVNVDHVATIRNARGGPRPDPVRAALLAIQAGADGITAHLREDRRHITDADMTRLKAAITKPLNFEMAATGQMLDIALLTAPHAVCLVPEKRTERTTEGGLDVVGAHDYLVPFVDQLARGGIRVSLFIEPSLDAIEAAVSIKAPVVELHTGAWCHAVETGDLARAEREFERVAAAAALAGARGLEVHAGHGLDYDTARRVAALPQVVELNIGHFLIGEAVFVGLAAAIGRMRAAMNEGRAQAG
jgi:pyridoxine 5-phosphate synthase